MADGDWELARRIVTPDVEAEQAARIGVRLCARALEAPHAAKLLGRHVVDASKTAFHHWPASEPSTSADWAHLQREFLAARPHTLSGHSAEQRKAVQWFEAHEISGLVQYFGSEYPIATATPLTTLRSALPTEHGEAFDDLIRRRAGSPTVARDVLAFIQEWGRVVDELHHEGARRPVTLDDYIQRWHVPQREALERLRLFNQILPGEYDPSALWELLWEAVPSPDRLGKPVFVRLISQPVVDTTEPPTLAAYFLASVHEQLTRPLGIQLSRTQLEPQTEQHNVSRDLRRLYALADIAAHKWSATALASEKSGAEVSLLGLESLPHVEDDETAAVVGQAIGSYRQHVRNRGPRAVLLSTQKCLRDCAALSQLNPPTALTPLLAGVRSAAASLAALCAFTETDVAAEMVATMTTLYAIL